MRRRARGGEIPAVGDLGHRGIPLVNLTDSDGKPRWADLFGIDPDWTDGKPIGEWLDEQRGEA